MAEYDDQPAEEGPPPIPGLDPALSAFRQAMPEGSIADEWAKEATATIQTFQNEKNIADAAIASSDQFAADIYTFKENLVGIARDDPSMTPMALALVEPSIAAIVGATGADPDGTHAAALSSEIQAEIARAGVQKYAILDEGLARRALSRYGEHLTDDDRGTLAAFINTMKSARAGDAAAEALNNARRAQIQSDVTAHGWLSRLSDPVTGDVALPNNWLRDMAADPGMHPLTKAALWGAHERLLYSHTPTSDPDLVMNLVERAAGRGPGLTPTEVLNHAGDGLTLADTQHLIGAAYPQPPATRAYLAQLADTMEYARGVLASPEDGLAGQRAFGRFVNWFMPVARAGAIMDPASPDYVLANGRLQAFAPTTEDAADAVVTPVAERPSLSEIFGGRRV